MWHVFYRTYRFQRRVAEKSYAVCATEDEAKELRAQCRKELKTMCWIEFIALRADLDG